MTTRVVLHRDPTTRGSLAGRYRHTDRHGRVWLINGHLGSYGYSWDVSIDQATVDLSDPEARAEYVEAGTPCCLRLSEVRAWLAEKANADDRAAARS